MLPLTTSGALRVMSCEAKSVTLDVSYFRLSFNDQAQVRQVALRDSHTGCGSFVSELLDHMFYSYLQHVP